MILVKDLLRIYIDKLCDKYSRSEATSIFFQLTTYFDNIERVDVSLDPLVLVNKTRYLYFLEKLQSNMPVQYILGYVNFYGLHLKVNRNVLIPRVETEELIEWIINDNKNKEELKILDIGTGSGAIAIALAKHLNADVTAIDISEKALVVARENAKKNNVKIHFHKQDVLHHFSFAQSFDIVLSNPPYVRESEKKNMHKNVLDFEPKLALFVSDKSSLIFYQKIIELVLINKQREVLLYFEINEFMKKELIQLLLQYNIKKYQFKKDFLDKYRMLKVIF